jgi:sugar/nucleoside kinase (ribokinase family)
MINYIAIGGITIDDTVIHGRMTAVEAPGGNSIYSALGARIWAEGVGVVSCIGPDYPLSFLKTLESSGLDLRGVQRVTCPSQHLWLLYEEDGSRQFIFHKKSGRTETGIEPVPGQIPAEYIQAKMAHLSAMGFALQQNMAKFLIGHGMQYSYDITQASLGFEGKEFSDSYVIHNCQLLLPSIEEVELIYGKQSLLPLLSRIARSGPKYIAVKLGARGSLVHDAQKNQTWHIPIYPAQVVDTTGAGDAYCGGFMAGFGETGDILEAGICGTASASFAIEEFGALHLLNIDKKEAIKRADTIRKNIEKVTKW